MKILFALIVLIAAACASSVEEQWQQFKQTHGKTYKSLLEEKRRFTIFKDTLREINEHNVKYNNGEFSYTMGVNQFSDMTQAEFDATLTPMEPMPAMPDDVTQLSLNATGLAVNENINWVTRGFVTPVRNQGTCGSCWAFSVAGALEALFKKTSNKLEVLSPQNLLDCSRNGGNMGCKGGFMFSGYDYVIKYGILTEAEYPYKGKQENCQKHGGKKIKQYYRLDGQSEDVLLTAINQVGPTSVAIDSRRIKNYASGVVDTNSGCTSITDHAVLVVGAGTENGKKYWLLKNSWGNKWGEKGYFKLIRGKKACGITNQITAPKS